MSIRKPEQMPEDVAELTRDEYKKRFDEGSLPGQKPVETEQIQKTEPDTGESLPEKKTAKLTLGKKPIDLVVASEEEQRKAKEQEEVKKKTKEGKKKTTTVADKSNESAEEKPPKQEDGHQFDKEWDEWLDKSMTSVNASSVEELYGLIQSGEVSVDDADTKARVEQFLLQKMSEQQKKSPELPETESPLFEEVASPVEPEIPQDKIKSIEAEMARLSEEFKSATGDRQSELRRAMAKLRGQLTALKAPPKPENPKEEDVDKTTAQTRENLERAKKQRESRKAASKSPKPEAPPKPENPKEEDVDKTTAQTRENLEKNKSNAEEAESASSPESTQEGSLQEVVRPWADDEGFKRLYRRAEFSPEFRGSVTGILDKDIDEERGKFLLKWFEENRNRKDIQKRGISTDISEQEKINIAIEMGAATELVGKKKYEKEFQRIENLSALRLDFRAKDVPLESQFLMLNHLEVKAEALKAEVKDLEGVGGAEAGVKREAVKRELERLFEIRKELAGKATGINIEAEADKELALDPEYSKTKEQYIEEKAKPGEVDYSLVSFDDRDSAKRQALGENYSDQDEQRALEWVKLKTSADITEEQLCGLMKAGYDPRTIEDNSGRIARAVIKDVVKNFWNLGIVPLVKHSRGGGLVSIKIGGREELMMQKDFLERAQKLGEGFEAGVLEKTKAKLGEVWEASHKAQRQEKIEQKIAEYASASLGARAEDAKGKAIRGVEAVYKNIKDRLIEEEIQRREKKKSKKATEKKDEKPEENEPESEKVEESKKEVNLTGDIKKDAITIMEFLDESGQEDWGIDINDVRKTDSKLYKEALKKQKKGGILAVVMHLLIGIQRGMQEKI